jgi:site-specific recombinase XerD
MNVTFRDMPELVAGFVHHLRVERGRSLNTVKRYQRTLEDFAEFVTDLDLALDHVSRDQIVAFAGRSVRGREPSHATWNARVAALRAFYGYLYRRDIVNSNPSLRVDRHRERAAERLPLSFDEALGVVDVIAKQSSDAYRSRNVAIFQLFVHSALRVAEVVSLNVGQVDFDNRVLLGVRAKGEKYLSVYFSDLVSEALERYLRHRSLLHPKASEQALFLSDRGTRMSVRSVQEMVRRYGRLAGISRPVTPHLLRHSSVSQLAEIGTPITVIQDICGHESIRTTQRYVHLGGEHRRSAVDALDKEWRRRKRSA